MMSDNMYFEGDPATDSTRRHLERVLKQSERQRRWPWVVAAMTGMAAWYLWPRGAGRARRESTANVSETAGEA
jgi:hypothetical protein